MTDFSEHLRQWATDPNEGIRSYISREVDRISKEMALAVESGARDELVRILTSQGYLVIAPSDPSPVAELVRAACRGDMNNALTAVYGIAQDPHVRAWVERGRK